MNNTFEAERAAAKSKVNPSFLKHIQIKLMVVNQYTKKVIYHFKEGVVKGTLLLFYIRRDLSSGLFLFQIYSVI